VEIPKKMWKFSEEFRKKPVLTWKIPEKCGNSHENVEIFGRIQEKTSVFLENSGKMWKFP
jgi:hypothetical protein